MHKCVPLALECSEERFACGRRTIDVARWTCAVTLRDARPCKGRPRPFGQAQEAVELARIELAFSPCHGDVFPLDDSPVDRSRLELEFPHCERGVLPLYDQPAAALRFARSRRVFWRHAGTYSLAAVAPLAGNAPASRRRQRRCDTYRIKGRGLLAASRTRTTGLGNPCSGSAETRSCARGWGCTSTGHVLSVVPLLLGYARARAFVLRRRFELPRPFDRCHLKAVRLPIPPSERCPCSWSWSGWRDLNPQVRAPKARALPLCDTLVGRRGYDPRSPRLQRGAMTTLALCPFASPTGFEPVLPT